MATCYILIYFQLMMWNKQWTLYSAFSLSAVEVNDIVLYSWETFEVKTVILRGYFILVFVLNFNMDVTVRDCWVSFVHLHFSFESFFNSLFRVYLKLKVWSDLAEVMCRIKRNVLIHRAMLLTDRCFSLETLFPMLVGECRVYTIVIFLPVGECRVYTNVIFPNVTRQAGGSN